MKIDDGATRARVPLLIAALSRLGVQLDGVDDLAQTPVLGGDRPVGAVRACLPLQA